MSSLFSIYIEPAQFGNPVDSYNQTQESGRGGVKQLGAMET